jgi:predicted transcriptional regulator
MRWLGELEASVMHILWDASRPMRVRDVLDLLNRDRRLAYTTVMTVLDNLHRKGWVVRELDGRAYRYQPATSRADAAVRALRDLLDWTGDPESVLVRFAHTASERESEVLRDALPRPAEKQ